MWQEQEAEVSRLKPTVWIVFRDDFQEYLWKRLCDLKPCILFSKLLQAFQSLQPTIFTPTSLRTWCHRCPKECPSLKPCVTACSYTDAQHRAFPGTAASLLAGILNISPACRAWAHQHVVKCLMGSSTQLSALFCSTDDWCTCESLSDQCKQSVWKHTHIFYLPKGCSGSAAATQVSQPPKRPHKLFLDSWLAQC